MTVHNRINARTYFKATPKRFYNAIVKQYPIDKSTPFRAEFNFNSMHLTREIVFQSKF